MAQVIRVEGDKNVYESHKDDVGLKRVEMGFERDRRNEAGILTTGAVDVKDNARIIDATVRIVESKTREVETASMLKQIELEKEIMKQTLVKNEGLELAARIKIDEDDIKDLETINRDIMAQSGCCGSFSKSQKQQMHINSQNIISLKDRIKKRKNELIIWSATVGSAQVKFTNGGALLDYSNVPRVAPGQILSQLEGSTKQAVY